MKYIDLQKALYSKTIFTSFFSEIERAGSTIENLQFKTFVTFEENKRDNVTLQETTMLKVEYDEMLLESRLMAQHISYSEWIKLEYHKNKDQRTKNKGEKLKLGETIKNPNKIIEEGDEED